MKRSPSLLLHIATVTLLLAASSGFGADPYYLAGTHLDPIALLAPPPQAGSEEQMADLATVRRAVDSRTPAEESAALRQESFNAFSFQPAIGSFFTTNHFPKTQAFFYKVGRDVSAETGVPKKHWQRPRPYTFDTNLLDGPPERSFSYPSGHSTLATVDALLLAELFPEHRDAILAYGRDIGWHRVMIGKHFPTDIYAGRVLGQAIVRELHQSPAFQHDLAEVQAEIHAHAPAN